MVRKEVAGKSLLFSTPGGIDGCEGKGRTRVLMEAGCVERRELRKERFFGVTRMVMVKPWMAS